jgi:hypothetical protein
MKHIAWVGSICVSHHDTHSYVHIPLGPQSLRYWPFMNRQLTTFMTTPWILTRSPMATAEALGVSA